MTVSGELCCVALPFCCVVVVALPFSASLERLFMYFYSQCTIIVGECSAFLASRRGNRLATFLCIAWGHMCMARCMNVYIQKWPIQTTIAHSACQLCVHRVKMYMYIVCFTGLNSFTKNSFCIGIDILRWTYMC